MRGSGGIAPSFLTSALDGSEWSASSSSRFTSRYPLDRKLGEPQSRSGRRGVQKNLLSLSGIEPQPSSQHPVAIPTVLSRIRLTEPLNIHIHLRRADHSSKESYRMRKNDYETEEVARAQHRDILFIFHISLNILEINNVSSFNSYLFRALSSWPPFLFSLAYFSRTLIYLFFQFFSTYISFFPLSFPPSPLLCFLFSNPSLFTFHSSFSYFICLVILPSPILPF
jgi:hypothetical protein